MKRRRQHAGRRPASARAPWVRTEMKQRHRRHSTSPAPEFPQATRTGFRRAEQVGQWSRPPWTAPVVPDGEEQCADVVGSGGAHDMARTSGAVVEAPAQGGHSESPGPESNLTSRCRRKPPVAGIALASVDDDGLRLRQPQRVRQNSALAGAVDRRAHRDDRAATTASKYTHSGMYREQC